MTLPLGTGNTPAEIATLRKDAEGRLIMGDPNLGCPHCGAVAVKEGTELPITILYHPANECCEARLSEEIGWRSSELGVIQNRITEDERYLDDLREQVQICRPQDRARYQAKLDRSEKIQQDKNDGYQEQLSELGDEITRLRRRLEEYQEAVA